MPRGHYGPSAAAQLALPAPAQSLVMSGAEIGPDGAPSEGGGSKWHTAAIGLAAAVTGVVVLGAITTSFHGPRRRRRGHASSPYRAMY